MSESSALRSKVEYGDFQTPLEFAQAVCSKLLDLGISPTVLIEPTCGLGNFLRAGISVFPRVRAVYGLDIQEGYVAECRETVATVIRDRNADMAVEIRQGSIFTDLPRPTLTPKDSVLILGNPPWVTNSVVSTLNGSNVPTKSNFKGHSGLDAMTGKSNFDISEYIILHLLERYLGMQARMAVLCKNAVIRRLVEQTSKASVPMANARAFTFDANSIFGVACDASLFVAEIAPGAKHQQCVVEALERQGGARRFGWVATRFVADVDAYRATRDLDGESPFVWRQGIKHDAAAVMELNVLDGQVRNAAGDELDLEPHYLFPLAKSSDLRTPMLQRELRKAVIVPQRMIGEPTHSIERTSPRLWNYLSRHSSTFDARKSSIYKGKPPFSVFGVGDYSFKPFKVAVSGLYKEPCFTLLSPESGKPVMLDDTCYFLGFETLPTALIVLAILNSEEVSRFLKAITFTDAKRPYTKEALMRIDLRRAASLVGLWRAQQFLLRLSKSFVVSESEWQHFMTTEEGDEQGLLFAS